jgi:tungstate transport system substrate-binding protein
LACDYLQTLDQPGSITWVANHSRNAQITLLRGHVDIALTYERDQEALAESEGWSVTKGCLFHDHFVVAGPISDPAEVAGTKSSSEALTKIGKSRSLFHSRQDGSATMWKEAKLWEETGLTPRENEGDSDWFKKSYIPPADALKNADAAGAYLITDRSTLLRQTGLGTISQTTVFHEPLSEDDVLMNSCYALCTPTAARDEASQVNLFINYALSERGQNIIRGFGVKECGFPLFAPVSEGLAHTRLQAGLPRGRQWVMKSSE